jgi:hypothetical protein
MPKSVRAAEAVAANPEKSDRAIAAEIGVDHKTVSKARKATGDHSPVERVGLDGKVRRLPQLATDEDEDEACTDCDGPQDFWARSLANAAGNALALKAFWTHQYGDWKSFVASSELVTLARQAAEEWRELASNLEQMKGSR